MYGQGSPLTARALRCSLSLRILIGIASVCSCALADDGVDCRVRIVWGGRQSKLWQGSIAVTRGTISELKLLGLDADQPGAFLQQSEKRVVVQPRMANRYAGVELRIVGDPNELLRIELTPDRETKATEEFEIPLSRLQQDTHEFQLDADQNILRVSRAPGDDLRIQFQRDSLVFSPGELFPFDFIAHKLKVKPNSTIKVAFEIAPAGRQRNDVTSFLNSSSSVVWSRTENLQLDATSSAPALENIEVALPEAEGVYVLRVSAYLRRGLSVTFGQQAVAQRHVQFVVVDDRSPRLFGGGEGELVSEFNPADPKWYDRLPQLPTKQRGPWFNQQPKTWDGREQSWTQLEADGWIAYSLQVTDSDAPHILEVQFPPKQQNVGISILEPNALGELSPVSLDSGVIVGDPDLDLPNVSLPAQPVTHRLVFWPRTTSPVVLITNRQLDSTSISFGKIRLEAYNQGLPTAASRSPHGRQRIGFLHRSLLKHIFLASDVRDGAENFSLDDWNTFYQAAIRLVEYLRYAGYDGVTLPAMSEGSSLYPSDLLNPTPKHDRGVFSSLGQDPVRKDVLEMLFRIFDREGLMLIPSVEFASPISSLEQELASSYPEETGIELRNVDGARWYDLPLERRGLAPYYNPLDTRVQRAMLSVIQEIANRYVDHESFGGLQINFSDNGYTHLPDASWGADRQTLSAFTKYLSAQGSLLDAETVQQRLADAIAEGDTETSPLLTAWLGWRAEILTSFYRRVSQFVTRGDEHRLYLSTSQLTTTAPWQRHVRPTLPRRTRVRNAMLDLGLDTQGISAIPRVVLLRPQRLGPLGDLETQAINLEVGEREVGKSFDAGPLSAGQFHHETQELRLESFDKRGPFGGDSYTLLWSHLSRAGTDARRDFARSLAQHDDQIVMVGGRALAMGQEDVLRPYFEVFRRLPNQPFESFKTASAGPVTARTAIANGRTYAYLVNNSPWPVTVTTHWSAPEAVDVESLGRQKLLPLDRSTDEAGARLMLEPYGLAGIRFNRPNVKLLDVDSAVPPEVSSHLRYQLNLVSSRVDQVKDIDPTEYLQDPGFERELQQDGPSWRVQADTTSSATIDLETKSEGASSLRMTSQGQPVVVTSQIFAAPQTGRLMVSYRVRATDDPPPQLTIRLRTNQPHYQPAHVATLQPSQKGFYELSHAFNDLPTGDGLQLSISFELRSAGTVWLDDIRMFDKSFERNEQNALDRILQVAHHQFNEGDLAGCYRTLNGYWPRFLLRYVPPPVQVATRPVTPASAKRVAPKQSMFDRLRRNTARLLRF